MTGAKLKELVTRTGITLTEIAKRMDVSTQLLNSYFKAEDVKSSTLERLCNALGQDIAWFYEGTSYGVSSDSMREHGQEGMAALIDQLEEKDRQLRAKDVQIDNLMTMLAAERGIKVREVVA